MFILSFVYFSGPALLTSQNSLDRLFRRNPENQRFSFGSSKRQWFRISSTPFQCSTATATEIETTTMYSAFSRSRVLLARTDVSVTMVKWWKSAPNFNGQVRSKVNLHPALYCVLTCHFSGHSQLVTLRATNHNALGQDLA